MFEVYKTVCVRTSATRVRATVFLKEHPFLVNIIFYLVENKVCMEIKTISIFYRAVIASILKAHLNFYVTRTRFPALCISYM